MSASAIARGIIDNLSAGSVIGACAVSTNYDVLQTTSGCCAVVTWTDHISRPVTFGTSKERGWTHNVEVFLRFANNPAGVMNNVITLMDKVVVSLENDDTLQGSAESIMEIRGNRSTDDALDVGGQLWLPFTVEVDTLEYP